MLKVSYENEFKKVHERMMNFHFVHSGLINALLTISECHLSSRESGQTNNLLLSGASGVGKTTLIHQYKKTYLEKNEELSGHPILYVHFPYQVAPKEIAICLLRELGIVNRNERSLYSLTNIVVQGLKQQCVELIILDSIEHLIDAETRKVNHECIEWLKALIDEVQVSFILAGLADYAKIVDSNVHLAGRIQTRVKLSPLEPKNEYGLFLQEIDQLLPFLEKSCLSEQSVVEKLYNTSGGLIGYTKEILAKAAYIASDEDRLTEWHVAKACNQLRSANGGALRR